MFGYTILKKKDLEYLKSEINILNQTVSYIEKELMYLGQFIDEYSKDEERKLSVREKLVKEKTGGKK